MDSHIESLRGIYTIDTVTQLDNFKKDKANKTIKNRCTCKHINIIYMINDFFAWYDNEYVKPQTNDEE